uniref:Rad60/SUMO-like domain-containing protein n=1 Tax=Oryza meridionalis TaxID=40149 RepID=A0A0E0EDG6_9ORYZ
MFGRSGITAAVKVEKEDDGKTPAAKRAGEYVTLKRTEQLQVLMDCYYDHAHGRVQRGTGRFLYDGRRLSGWQTPAELDIEDGDEVDFFEELIDHRRRQLVAGGRGELAHHPQGEGQRRRQDHPHDAHDGRARRP